MPYHPQLSFKAWDGMEQFPPLGTDTEMSPESLQIVLWSLPAALPPPPLRAPITTVPSSH